MPPELLPELPLELLLELLPEPPPEPAFPFPDTWNKEGASEAELERFAAWKRRMHAWHMSKKELRKAQQGIGQALRVSGSAAAKVWFPTFIDSRGRYYYRGVLNPQGEERCKGPLLCEVQ